MTPINIALLLDLIIQGTLSLQKYAQLIRAARADGNRDVTDAELRALAAEDDVVARAEEAAIAARKAREAGTGVG